MDVVPIFFEVNLLVTIAWLWETLCSKAGIEQERRKEVINRWYDRVTETDGDSEKKLMFICLNWGLDQLMISNFVMLFVFIHCFEQTLSYHLLIFLWLASICYRSVFRKTHVFL